MGLDPADALAAASVWPRHFIAPDHSRADIVTITMIPERTHRSFGTQQRS
jgi:hypothetical protein